MRRNECVRCKKLVFRCGVVDSTSSRSGFVRAKSLSSPGVL